ncbi:MAG: PilZ domain-containing protein [Deltaproteobacteria bacterium]|nr:PilZ domain-containing protein [Deltaproteobacteria bacterium]
MYSIRMNRSVLKSLKRAAYKDRRTVASLLDKIILDYLEKEGFVMLPDFGMERRRFQRKNVTLPATSLFKARSKVEPYPTVILNISQGGVLLTYPKNFGIKITSSRELPQFEILFTLPFNNEQVHFPCEAHHMSDNSKEIHIGASFSEPNKEELQKLQINLM